MSAPVNKNGRGFLSPADQREKRASEAKTTKEKQKLNLLNTSTNLANLPTQKINLDNNESTQYKRSSITNNDIIVAPDDDLSASAESTTTNRTSKIESRNPFGK